LLGLELSNLQRPALISGSLSGGSGSTPSPLTSGASAAGADSSSTTANPDTDTNTARPNAIRDRIELSPAAQSLAQSTNGASQSSTSSQANAGADTSGLNGELTEAEQKQVEELKKRDQEVRTHEQAHQRVGGQYASAPTYDYQKGPDGRRYAVGGQVQIDASAIPGDPQATIEKMRIVKAAALAPAEPSSQDRKVAAAADSTAQQAQSEKIQMEREEREAMINGEATPEELGQTLNPMAETGSEDNAQTTTDAAAPNSPGTMTEQSGTGAGPEMERSEFEGSSFAAGTQSAAQGMNANEDEGENDQVRTGFSGAVDPQSALINQANGAYAASTRAEAINQIPALIA